MPTLAVAGTHALRVTLTGAVALEADGEVFDERLLGGRQPRIAFAILVAERHRAVHHEEIAEALWPQELPATWEPALRGVISKVRSFLGKAGLPGSESITSAFGCYQIHLPPEAEVDVEIAFWAVDDAMRALDDEGPETACRNAEAARAILVRPFLAGEEGTWIETKRDELRSRLVRALDTLVEGRLRQGEPALAVEAADECLALDPFRETGFALLMRAHAAAGNRGEALRAYERCRMLLFDELGVDPSPLLQGAYHTLLASESGEAAIAATDVARPGERSNLPHPISSFVGRERELAEIGKLVSTERLVTLTGPGGCGKTRLALRVASERLQDHRDGVWFVDMAPISQPDLVPRAVAEALSVGEQQGRSSTETIVDHLRSRDVLLVLDNCEHVVGSCAALTDVLLRAGPRVRVLATSREALAVSGEIAWRVLGLDVPFDADDLETLVAHDGPLLFIERARQARPDLTVANADAPVIAEICSHLDGIPLAIELAAARAGTMALREIATRLDDRFRFLTAGARTALGHHQTLHAAFDWTYEHLDREEQRLLGHLSVFVGGFTLEAAEAIAEGGDGIDVLAGLTTLAGKSMLECDVTGERARYRLLETIRAYASEHLDESGESDRRRNAHLEWCIEIAEGSEEIGLARWLDEIDVELGNMRAALDWAVSHDRPEAAQRLAGALAVYWHSRGQFVEGRNWLRVSLELGDDVSAAVRASALWGLGRLASIHGDFADAIAASNECVRLSRDANDARLLANALSLQAYLQVLMDPGGLGPILDEAVPLAQATQDARALAEIAAVQGWSYFYRGDGPSALPFFSTCLDLAREHGDLWNERQGEAGIGLAAMLSGDYASARTHLTRGLELARVAGIRVGQMLCYLGELARLTGEYEDSRLLLEEAREVGRRSGSQFEISIAVGLLARLKLADGDAAAARPMLADALALTRSIGLRNISCWWLQGLAEASLLEGDPRAARDHLDEAMATARDIDNLREIAKALQGMAAVAQQEGDVASAESMITEALSMQRKVGDRPGMVDSIEVLAGVLVEMGQSIRALRLLGVAEAARAENRYHRRPIDAARYDADRVRAAKSAGAGADEEFAEGRASSLEEVIDEATSIRREADR
jgi:predicted ATPase/DNA-binding SARP family transcriptional activator